ncbi:tRNA pseudouridine(55) synthase TruB [Rhodoferax sp. 4810]|uniref:tRNA pseudouridine synthase B n=1 Tax=Thiospirillum jenense TaxID=1653858 RepID=A0A839H718_9GAMM|nr:tRNA pseudouridine(55) synthase TruB [Thiospirillum jenense]MBB1074673.1 tRNA pseudouridine(55) synthase TruB [Rhodoferax jenense]MBB1125483.1 tRNA pseudouridine(55) synthase TruB [Thiospirillum jenense]
MAKRPSGRAVAGILLLDKPIGITSNHALQRVKRLFYAAKAGHTGSLDPLATGLLPLCLGYATKFSTFLLDADKHYRVRVRLGETTTTADAEGEVLATASTAGITESAVRSALTQFTGAIEQLPPMYSAVKYHGERLYKLARAGQEVERTPRTIHIYQLDLLAVDLPDIELDVHCSKGTYVRTLAEDIGKVLGCGGHVAALRRTGVGPYLEMGDTPTQFITMTELETISQRDEPPAARYSALDALLLPLDTVLGHCPAVKLSADAAFYLRQGQSVLIPQAPTDGLVRLYDPSGHFIGIGDILDDGKVQPRRLL